MQPTVVKTSKPSDFLALVPELVGFHPENSVALVAFRGNRTCGALRFTLPERGAGEKLYKRIATTIVGMVCKIPNVDALVPVVYTDDRFADGPGIPEESFARILIQRSELSGFLVRDAFCVAADGWGSYQEPGCPPGGHPLSDLAAFAQAREVRAEERKDLGSLESWADLPTVGFERKERVARLFRRYQRLGRATDTATDSVPELFEAVGNLIDPVETAEVMLAWDTDVIDDSVAAALLFLIQGPCNRDQMMLQFAFGERVGAQAYEVNARYAALQRATGLSMDDIVREEHEGTREELEPDAEPRGSSAEDISNLMMGFTRTRPDPERIETAIGVLKTVTALAPRSARPAPLCMLAWLSWALGRGSVAGIFIDRALQIDPHYGMATLLYTLIGTGHLPEWAYAVPADATTTREVADHA